METKARERTPELDGIRGLAIILVLIYHYGYYSLDGKASAFNYYFKAFTKYFYSGVDLFFILSGFLLGGILISNKSSEKFFSTFYIRRICRIFPIYFLSIFAVYIICSFGIGKGTVWWFNDSIPFASYLFFVQNIFIGFEQTLGNKFLINTWSLALEEQFYLILPLLTYFLPKKWLVIILGLCVLSAPVFRHNTASYFEAFTMIYCRFDSLFTGVLIAVAVKNKSFLHYCEKFSGALFLLLIALLGFTALFSFGFLKLNFYDASSWFSLLWSLFIIVVLTNKRNVFSGFMRNGFLIKTGLYSYGIYVYHQIILGFLFLTLKRKMPHIDNFSDFGLVLFSLAVTIIVSYVSFHFLEKKFIDKGHEFKY